LATLCCGCGRYAENGIPCSYAIAFIFHKNESFNAYLPDALKTETQIAAYCEAMPPISIAGLKPAMDDNADSNDEGLGQACNLLMTRVPRGRPRKIRQDKGNYRATRGVGAADLLDTGDRHWEKRIVLCGACGEEGHYSTTCRRAHN
jgi:hypothetical protein